MAGATRGAESVIANRKATSEEKLPPFSESGEMGVVGCMILDPDCIPLACEKLTDDSFFDMRIGCLFAALQSMHEAQSHIDPLTLMQFLRDANSLDAIGGPAYIAALQNAVPSASALEHYVEIVREKHQLRRLIQTCTQTVAKVYDSQSDAEGLIEEFSRESQAVCDDQHSAEAIKPIPKLVHGAMMEIEARHDSKGKPRGIPTGFPDLDRMTSGLQNSEMIVIAARPSCGKTALAMNIVEHVAIEQKLAVGVFSLEMTAESLTLRMLCSRARVNMKNIDDGFLAERDYPKLTEAATQISKAPLFIDDSSELGIKQIRGRARRMVQKHGCKMFVIDYFGLIARTGKAGDDRVELGKICVGVKAMAKELDVPVILICQLNRELDKEKKRRPRLSDLRDSGQIEMEADLVGFLYEPEKKDDDTERGEGTPVNLMIAKQRNGPTGDVQLTFLKSITRFESLSKVADVPDESMI